MSIRTGQCLCGAVKRRATLPGSAIESCHCVQCQRWTGGGAYHAILADDLQVEGKDNVRTYRASDWGERANCATCGSPLWWRLQGRPVRMIAVGLLDDQSGLTVTDEIFTDRRAPWMPVHAGATQATEAEKQSELREFLESTHD